VVVQQVRRMLGDPKARALTANFAGQWLYLRNLSGIQPNSDLFPDFDDNLRQAMRTEAELFFDSIVREDRSVVDLLTANDTFVNERLARHYGIAGVVGARFRRVTVADARRGLLGKGAILLATSHATTTSPVLRGKWILDNLLGSPPPAPPPDVPAARGERSGGARVACASSWSVTAPTRAARPATSSWIRSGSRSRTSTPSAPGARRVRRAPRSTPPTSWPNGRRIEGVAGLRAALTERPEIFVRTFVEKLLVYALGRGLEPEDMPAVRAIVRDARAGGYRFSAIAAGIARSVPFRMRGAARPEGTLQTALTN
jgi:hypothetical protein